MAAPVHYIRTIHTSFTAAHPHSSSAWASPRTHAQLLNLTAVYPPGLHVVSNNNVVGRKRSASIRGMPPSYVQRIQPQRVKFDPFAEDSDPSVLYNSYHAPPPRNLVSRTTPSIPYTIHIPPAAPADIQRHYQQQHQQQQQYRQHQQHQQQYHHHPQPMRVRSPQPQSPKLAPQRVSTPAPAPTLALAPAPAPAPAPATPKAVAAPVPNPAVAAKEREARSKIVAGILLNRVHAVGKPMRRRSPSADQPRPYVPSGLSTCIALEL